MPRTPNTIYEPEIRIFRTAPSSLGIISTFMVLFDRLSFVAADDDDSDDDFDSLTWGINLAGLSGKMEEIAEDLDDESFHLPLYVLHATQSNLSSPIRSLDKNTFTGEDFSRNIFQYGQGMTGHCAAIKMVDDLLQSKVGFHYWSSVYDGPESWDSMQRANGKNGYVQMRPEEFWSLYQSVLVKWNHKLPPAGVPITD